MGGYIGARSGTISATVANVQDVTATDSTPEVTIVNNTHEDTDGGREGKVIFKGQQSGGEESTLAEIQASHDGTADDEKGDLIFRTNDGSDGASPTERVRVDSAGFVGINESAPSGILHVKGTSAAHGKVILEAGGSGGSANNNFVEFNKHDGTKLAEIEVGETVTNGGDIVLKTTPASGSVTERMRVLNNGRVGIGTNSPAGNVNGNSTVLEVSGSGSNPPEILAGGDNAEISIAGGSAASYLWSTGNHPLIVATNGTEQFRFTTDKQILVGNTAGVGSSQAGVQVAGTDGYNFWRSSTTATTGYDQLVFINGNGVVGRVTTSGSGTTYGSGSDYRLKENVVNISDGITRVKQLSPRRFNFIADADTTVDGFLAHEAQTVVPEAVTGTKDAVEIWKEHEELPDGVSVGDNKLDDDGNTIPEYQAIDQSKLVPLLTAALQEAIAKIETLETKVAALEAE